MHKKYNFGIWFKNAILRSNVLTDFDTVIYKDHIYTQVYDSNYQNIFHISQKLFVCQSPSANLNMEGLT